MVSSDHIGPGGETEIEVKVETKGKRGRITKTVQIQSNDPRRPLVVIKLYADVIDVYHTLNYPADQIFRTPCRQCHVDRGIGKSGAQLFWADCLMCHQRGKIASPVDKLRRLPEEVLRKAIEEGVPGTPMPGFGTIKGGPLTIDQIRSLVRYIKGL